MFIREYFADFISLFYPHLCLGCSEPLPKGVEHICVKCRDDLPKTNNHKLQIEGIEDKFNNLVEIKHLFVYCYFHKSSPFQRLIHQMKYKDKPELGRMLGSWYADEIISFNQKINFDYLVPVPLHPAKLKKRGYNQSQMICEGLNDVIMSTVLNDVLFRVKGNRSLTGLGKVERIKALRDTYQLNPMHKDELKDKDLLLVDDIMTTGSTLIACYEELIKSKPRSISFLLLGAAQ